MNTDRTVRDLRHSTDSRRAFPRRDILPRRRAAASDALVGSLTRAAGLQQEIEIRTDLPGAGWWRCSDLLADPHGFAPWHERLADWLRTEHGTAPARTVAGYVMSWYLRVPAYVGALLLHHERRVPTLRPEELAIRIDTNGRPDVAGIAVLGGAFHCLPLDPCAGHAEATVVADERALAAMLRARFTAHAARFVRTYRRAGPHGTRMLWAAATDALDSCLWRVGLQGGDEGAGVADATLVLESRFPPLTSASTLRAHAGEDGHRVWSRRRESCCFNYLLPGQVECGTCPRISPPQR